MTTAPTQKGITPVGCLMLLFVWLPLTVLGLALGAAILVATFPFGLVGAAAVVLLIVRAVHRRAR